jgi:hypothetical protein
LVLRDFTVIVIVRQEQFFLWTAMLIQSERVQKALIRFIAQAPGSVHDLGSVLDLLYQPGIAAKPYDRKMEMFHTQLQLACTMIAGRRL